MRLAPSKSPQPSGPEHHPKRGRDLPAELLAQIGDLGFQAQMIAHSAIAGVHRSRHHGSSVEFAEHKEYAPGDDVRHLDWRAFARFDRDYIKRFEDETNLHALIIVDQSASMAYPEDTDRASKLAYSCLCAGALAYVFARQGDAVGLASFNQELSIRVPARARRGHLQELLRALDELKAEGPSRLSETLDNLAGGLRRRSVVIVLSDLFDGGIEALPKLAQLRAQQHDVVLMHVLDPDELEFPFEDNTLFEGLESGEELAVDAEQIQSAYLEEMAAFRREAESACHNAKVEYQLARTDKPAGLLIRGMLAARTDRRRVRR